MKTHLNLSAIAAAVAISATAHAGISFVNGGFETTTNGAGQINNQTQVTGWTVPNGGYTFVGTAAQFAAGVPGQYGDLSLWDTSNGGADTLKASPFGGNFLAQDGDYLNEPIQQTVSGLTPGKAYDVTFAYAFAQQTSFYGATNQYWNVSLGSGPVQSTNSYALPSQGFSGWKVDTMKFVADAASDTLTFAAVGDKPVPPFALLDGVTVSPAPEPATWAMMILGVAAIGAIARRRRAAAMATA